MDLLQGFFDAERTYSTLPPTATEEEKKTALDKWMSYVDAEQFVLHQSPDLPWGGEYKGREGFIDCAGRILQWTSKIDVEMHTVAADAEGTTVFTYITVHWTSRQTGEDGELLMTQVWKIDKEKKVITDLRPFCWDVQGVKEKLQVSP